MTPLPFCAVICRPAKEFFGRHDCPTDEKSGRRVRNPQWRKSLVANRNVTRTLAILERNGIALAEGEGAILDVVDLGVRIDAEEMIDGGDKIGWPDRSCGRG